MFAFKLFSFEQL